MAMQVSHMAENLIGSEIIRIAGEIKAKIRQGEKIFNLTIGDFNPSLFPIPTAYRDEIIAAYNAGITNYPSANGMQELREAISGFIARRQGLEYDANDILVSSGARPIIFATYMAILDPGDKVIYPLPSWNNNHYTHITSSKHIIVETNPESNFMLTADMIRPHIQEANMIALCSPLNPTGTVFPKDQLAGICELVLEENKRRGDSQKPLYVLYDQIYWNLTYNGTVHHDPVSLYPEMRKYTVFVDGMSKAFAATGVRVGWTMGPSYVIQKMRSILSHAGAWSPKAEQMATAAYLNKAEEVDQFLEGMREKLYARLDGFYKGFQSLKAKGHKIDAIAPQAAIYLTVKLDLVGMVTEGGTVLQTSDQVRKYLLDEASLALVPFYAFGAARNSPWFRLSVGTARIEDIPTVISNVDRALSKLKVGEVSA